ncbi:MAG: aminotransferase class V-fold PLP-dependent enzyme, partial [Gemmatimonadetes bacterium]|nr:aminotransferase class V-fold PLP-dependent enzyme [Gemmatimonadota bacterium]
EVILTDEEHPAVQIPAERLPESDGVVLRYLPITGSAEDVLSRLDDLMTPRTRMLALSHVTTDTGTRLPAKQIVDRAHERDIPVLYDAAQSLGQFAVDVTAMGADFYSCLGYKWMFGPYATGCLYVHPSWQERLTVVPSGVNYGSSEGARRFEFSLMPATHYIATAAAVDYLESIGLDQIEAHARNLAARLREGLRQIPGLTIESPEDPEMNTGIVAFSVDGVDGPHISTALRNHDIVTRPTGMKFSGVRFSVAMFTTQEEIDAAIDAVTEIVEVARA